MGKFDDDEDKTLTVKSGNAAVLEMPEIESYPTPLIDWYTPKGIITSAVKYAKVRNKLIILDTNYDDDESSYTAKAINAQLGQEEFSPLFRLKVSNDNYNYDDNVSPSLIIKPDEDMKIINGQENYLHCVANAKELNDIITIWTKDDVPIEESGIRFNFLDFWNRTLELITPNRTYSGVYGCRVEIKNNAYPPITASSNVVVYGKLVNYLN